MSEVENVRKEIGMKPHIGKDNNDTPRRRAIANAHVYLKMLNALGRKNGEKFADYAKIAESQKEAEETIDKVMGEEKMINAAIDAYWDEFKLEDELEQGMVGLGEREK